MPKDIKEKQKKRKVISLETKIQILDRLRKGETVTRVSNVYSIHEATIRTIRKSEDSIRKSVAAGTKASMSTTSYVRNIQMENMEKALMIWIEDQTQKRIPIDTNAITNKAIQIFEKLNDQLPSTSTSIQQAFCASHGWFEKFKQRHSLHNLKLKGEQSSADIIAAQEYPEKFSELISAHSYTRDQIFNADETGLYWKKMPDRTFVAKSIKSASGYKTAKDRITILFCSNASGDYIMKPLVINKAQTPRAFKGIIKENLPVYWMANKKAWVTAATFSHWFYTMFVPDVKRYLNSKGQPIKALLLVDNAPGHPIDLEHENIKVVFLPKNTTSLLQPLDQGIISTFKALYIKLSFRHILEQIDSNASLSVIDAWKKFSILDCVKHVALAYTEIRQSTLQGCWKKLWPAVCESSVSLETLEQQYSEIINLANSIGGEGFDDFSETDILQLMADEELDAGDLVDMVNQQSQTVNDAEEENAERVDLTTKTITEGLEMGRKLANHFLKNDPNVERAVAFQRHITQGLAQYVEVYKELNNKSTQLLITNFTCVSKRPELVSKSSEAEKETAEILSSDDE